MSLLSDVVGIANEITQSLGFQTTVSIARYKGPADVTGTRNYGAKVAVRAVLERKQRSVRTPNGGQAISSATITFVDIPALVAATPEVKLPSGQVHPAGQLAVEDQIFMPDGTTQEILDVGGFIDPESNTPAATEVYLA